MTTRTAAGLRRRPIGVALCLLLVGGCAAPSSPGPSTPATEQPTPWATAGSTVAVPPTAQPTPVGTLGEFEWQHIGRFDASAVPLGMAASPVGYAVLTWDHVWFSTDGRAWTSSTLPFAETSSNGADLVAHANAIAGGPNGFVVVGGQLVKPCDHVDEGAGGPPPCMVAPISWSSPDGITWTSSLPTPIPATGARLPDYTELVSIWPAGGGWDAAAEARASVVSTGNALLHSKDGLVWASLKAAPLLKGMTSGKDVNAHGGVSSGTGTLLLWQYSETNGGIYAPRTELSTTADGKTWAEVPSFDGQNAYVRFALAPGPIGAGTWLLIGHSDTPRGVTWWQSDDLATWRSGPIISTGPPMQSISALSRWGDGYMALGTQDDESYPGRPGTFLSDDGMTWRPAGFVGLGPLDGPFVMAEGPAGLIGIGTDGVDSAVWFGVDPRR